MAQIYVTPLLNLLGFLLIPFTKFGDDFVTLLEAGTGELAGPLVAQNKTYTRYSTGYNESGYNDMLAKKSHLHANQSRIVLPAGSIDVKAAQMGTSAESHEH